MGATAYTPPKPTQVKHPWQATARTVFQALVGFAAMWGLIVEVLGIDSTLPWVAASLVVTAGITRLMALPAFNDWLAKFIPGLAAGDTEPTEQHNTADRLDP